MQQVTVEWLQSLDALKDVPASELQWWIDNSEHFEMNEGDFLFRAGEHISGTHVVVKGKLSIVMVHSKGERVIRVFETGDVSGYLPFSRGYVAFADAVINEPTQIMCYPVGRIKELIMEHYELTEALVHVMTSRVRTFTSLQQQNEKMMALGKLSAGLAHELNNPAAAIVRGSQSLLSHLKLKPEVFKQMTEINMETATLDKMMDRLFEVLGRQDKPSMTLMQRTELEDELAECFEKHSVENSLELAETFIDAGFTCDDVEAIAGLVPTQHLSSILNWINNSLVTERMVTDIQHASQRIEKLVNAVKNFTHMDRDQAMEYIDIHSGIRNTLNMLEYKIRKGNIEIKEAYDENIPKVKAHVGELNQVWTNLIDNAIDAMEVNHKGVLEIITTKDKNNVVVSFIDNGPGIPDDIKSQIFDPFFTTKEIGKGTGLGLDVVTRIVDQHKGTIKVESKPGRTMFEVCFPING